MTGSDGQITAPDAVTGNGRGSASATLTTAGENTAPFSIDRHCVTGILTLEQPQVAPEGSAPPTVQVPMRTRLKKLLSIASSFAGAKPLRSLGGFFAMSLDTLVLIFKPPFAWREYLLQTWFVARVSIMPTLMLTIPYTVLLVFTFNILLIEFGAADFSGTGAAYGSVTQLGPVVTVLVVAGAGATAMCADLGARTIREELDALRVMGIDPIQALVVPRVLAATTVALALSSTVILVGLGGGYLFCVYVQHVSPGAFVSGMTLITGAKDVVIALAKAGIFGLAAGLIACYKGISVAGGPAGVGNAVNETVVFTFMALFAINVIATAVGVQATI